MAEANACLNAVKESAEPATAKEGLSQMDDDSGQVSKPSRNSRESGPISLPQALGLCTF